MLNKLAKIIQAGWSEPNLLTFLLLPLSGVYRVLMALRKVFYKNRWFHVYQSPVPVLIVGNISVGGTGKTPLTIAMVEKARKFGFEPGVVSRGYGGQALDWPQAVTPETTPHYVGDESVLISQSVECPVVVGPKRSEAIELLLANNSCDLIISDDGLQHYAIARDAEIAVIDDQRRNLNSFCLPAGPLREPTKRLNSVDQVFRHVPPKERSEGDFSESKDNLFRLKNNGFRKVVDHQVSELDANRKIHAVAGIGHPLRFFRQLRAMGFDVEEHAFADHHRYIASDFDFVNEEDCVIMTAKDAVKCATFAMSDWYYLTVEVEFNQAAEQRIEELFSSLKDNPKLT